MNLSKLIEAITPLDVAGDAQVEIKGITYDSRQVKPGWLFVAIPGANADGAAYISDALSNGAAAILSEHQIDPGHGIVHIQVSRARSALADLANTFYGNLSEQMKVIGVTGTNGKTTTCYMIRHILDDGGFVSGLLGTVAYEIGGRSIPASRTTPEASDTHAMFHQMRTSGCDSVVMEVSSHAIAMERVRGIDFSIGVFTNLTHDHLDFHKDMNSYFDTKANLFESLDAGKKHTAVINIDDPWGRRLVEERKLDVEIVPFGFGEEAVIRAHNIEPDADGTRFRVDTPWGKGRVHIRMAGRHNVHNALAALAVGGLCGIDLKRMVQSLETLETVPGRMEPVPNRRGRKIFVDYAHTDDALENVLTTLREICRERLIVVFGCGGNRDRGKREKMGRAACELADYSIVTSDNPRREDPGAIAGDIIKGFDDTGRFEVVLDRREAIETGIAMMNRKDMLLIAGKGHETYQEIDGTIVPFDDREVVREILG
jgi:UDP-N-acetylmuramoyl-L-alanyl-D-glutamate--2,6-diaminopimelate ligase